MTDNLRDILLKLARENVALANDPSHDMLHTLRVLANAEKIAAEEGADLDIVIPAALFHDAIVYPKKQRKGQRFHNRQRKISRKDSE